IFTTGPEMLLRHHGVGLFYLACSQCFELEHKFKELNRQRTIHSDSDGKLIIHVDIPDRKVEVKREIMENLHVDPVQLRSHLRLQAA
ncbi:27702_t:CDS:2, partial [Racocetra persica]